MTMFLLISLAIKNEISLAFFVIMKKMLNFAAKLTICKLKHS